MRYQVNIPEGSSGDFKIMKFTVDNWLETPEPLDIYTVLLYDPTGNGSGFYPIMQDTSKEYRECQPFVNAATGDVLIAGLGLGCVHIPLLNNPNITSVTIVEKYQEVIDMVWDHCPKDSRFSLIKDDIYTWTPTKNFDVAWFDSWIAEDATPEHQYFYYSPLYEQAMTNKYGSFCDQMFFWKSETTPNNNPLLEG